MRAVVFRFLVNRWAPPKPPQAALFTITPTTIITSSTKIRSV